MSGIIGKKIGMTSIYDEQGKNVPCTVIEAGPCVVTQVRTVEKEGYSAIQLAYEDKKEKHSNKAEMGHFAKAKTTPKKVVAEFTRFEHQKELGEVVTVDVFIEGEFIDAVGTTKGKGFQGVIKRSNFSGCRASHGSMFHRSPGSIGGSAWPSRVFKGKKMAGQMGNARVTTQNLQIVDVRPEQNLVLVKGAIPGPKNSLVIITRGVKAKK